MDLSDLDSVRSFGAKAQAGGQPLDVLCNNAGELPSRGLESSATLHSSTHNDALLSCRAQALY